MERKIKIEREEFIDKIKEDMMFSVGDAALPIMVLICYIGLSMLHVNEYLLLGAAVFAFSSHLVFIDFPYHFYGYHRTKGSKFILIFFILCYSSILVFIYLGLKVLTIIGIIVYLIGVKLEVKASMERIDKLTYKETIDEILSSEKLMWGVISKNIEFHNMNLNEDILAKEIINEFFYNEDISLDCLSERLNEMINESRGNTSNKNKEKTECVKNEEPISSNEILLKYDELRSTDIYIENKSMYDERYRNSIISLIREIDKLKKLPMSEQVAQSIEVADSMIEEIYETLLDIIVTKSIEDVDSTIDEVRELINLT